MHQATSIPILFILNRYKLYSAYKREETRRCCTAAVEVDHRHNDILRTWQDIG